MVESIRLIYLGAISRAVQLHLAVGSATSSDTFLGLLVYYQSHNGSDRHSPVFLAPGGGLFQRPIFYAPRTEKPSPTSPAICGGLLPAKHESNDNMPVWVCKAGGNPGCRNSPHQDLPLSL